MAAVLSPGTALAGTGSVRPRSARNSAADSVEKCFCGAGAAARGAAGAADGCGAWGSGGSGAVWPREKRRSPLPGVASAARTVR